MLKHFLIVLLASLSVSALPKLPVELGNNLRAVDQKTCELYGKRCYVQALYVFTYLENTFYHFENLLNSTDAIGTKLLYLSNNLDSFQTLLKPYSYNLETIGLMKAIPRTSQKEIEQEYEHLKNDVSFIGDNAEFFQIVSQILDNIKYYIKKFDREMEKSAVIIKDTQFSVLRNKAAVVEYKMYNVENQVSDLLEVVQYLKDLLFQKENN